MATILIVDDDLIALQSRRRILTKAGHQANGFSSLQKALRRFGNKYSSRDNGSPRIFFST